MTPHAPAPATPGETTAGAGTLNLHHLPGRCPGCEYHVATQGCRCEGSEWSTFVAAIRKVTRADGTVHQADMRPLIRGVVNPKSIGTFYRRAKSEGLLVDTGDREPSNDSAGRNLDKLDRIYALRRAA